MRRQNTVIAVWVVILAVVGSFSRGAPVTAAPASPQAEAPQYGGTYTGWPTDAQWVAISALNDPDDGLAEHLDFVGDANNPAVYYYSGSNYLYFRLRVDTGTGSTAGTFTDTIMIVIDKNGDGTADYGFAWDSKAVHGMEMMVLATGGTASDRWSGTTLDDVDGSVGQKVAPDFDTDGRSGDAYVRTVDGINTTNFGTTTFIDIAVKWAYFTYLDNWQAAQSPPRPATGLGPNQTWRIQVASIANATDHNAPNADIASNQTTTSFVTFPGVLSTAPLAVDLASFTAESGIAGVTLAWETVSEMDNAGFNIYRAGGEAGPWVKLNAAPIPAAAPGASAGHAYTWTDATAAPGAAYWYQLEDVALDGTLTRHAPVQASAANAPNAVGLAGFGGAAALPASFIITALVAATGLAAAGARRRGARRLEVAATPTKSACAD